MQQVHQLHKMGGKAALGLMEDYFYQFSCILELFSADIPCVISLTSVFLVISSVIIRNHPKVDGYKIPSNTHIPNNKTQEIHLVKSKQKMTQSEMAVNNILPITTGGGKAPE